MKEKTIPWAEATLDELKKFAVQVLGIYPAHNVGIEALRSKIRQTYTGDTITIVNVDQDDGVQVSDAPPADQVVGDGTALRGTSASRDPKVKITIPETDGPGGKRGVFVSVNGVAMIVPRGKPVDIPYRYYLVLANAVKTVHEQDEETQEIISTDVPSYPMGVNLMPPQAEIDAYYAAERSAA